MELFAFGVALALFSGFWSWRFFLGAADRLDNDELLAAFIAALLGTAAGTLAFTGVRIVVELMV